MLSVWTKSFRICVRIWYELITVCRWIKKGYESESEYLEYKTYVNEWWLPTCTNMIWIGLDLFMYIMRIWNKSD